MGRLRIFLALLLVDWLFGIPGLGVETRTGSNNGAMDYVYTVVGLALILALALTWFRPRYAGPLAMVVGAAAVLLAVADMTGLTSGQAAPPAMIAVDLGGIVIGAGIIWAASRASERTRLPA